MSYDVYLTDPVTHETLRSDARHDMRGGTYALGGTDELWLNVTYNYSPQFARAFEGVEPGGHARPRFDGCYGEADLGAYDPMHGVRKLYGMTGAESIPVLETAMSRLGDDVDPDYWKPTDGNAKRALAQLLAMARLRPDGIWDGD